MASLQEGPARCLPHIRLSKRPSQHDYRSLSETFRRHGWPYLLASRPCSRQPSASHAAYTHALRIDGNVRNQGWCERRRNNMVSVGRSVSLRRRARTRAFAAVGASEGFAAARVMWICALWALIHSVLASKQAKNLARRVAGPRYCEGLYRSTYNVQSINLLRNSDVGSDKTLSRLSFL